MIITVSHGITDHRPSSHVSNGKNTASQQESVFLDTGIAATYIFNAGRAALTRTSARSSMSGGFFEDASRATVSDTGEETLLISYSGCTDEKRTVRQASNEHPVGWGDLM
jgi:hypothetical protein